MHQICALVDLTNVIRNLRMLIFEVVQLDRIDALVREFPVTGLLSFLDQCILLALKVGNSPANTVLAGI